MPQNSPPLHHASPTALVSPSTAHASMTPAPVAASHHNVTAPQQIDQALLHRQRASVACKHCRRQKIKCRGDGPGNKCLNCQNKNQECIFELETPSSTNDGLRRGSSTGEVDVPPRKRKKLQPVQASTSIQPHRLGTSQGALESPALTPKVWNELFEIYKKHLAIDFPFIHKKTFFDALEQRPHTDYPQDSTANRPYQAFFLLSFLTQTARFHPDLVKEGARFHSDWVEKTGPALATAIFYAEACRATIRDLPSAPDLDLVQGCLMLGHHEWHNGEGVKGAMRIRVAFNCADELGLRHDADRDEQELSSPLGLDKEHERFIQREIERRTMWTCFYLGRCLDMRGKCKQMLTRDDMQKIQLVCSDLSFNKRGRMVRTRLLGESDEAYMQRRHQLSKLNKQMHDEANGGSPRQQRKTTPRVIVWEVGEEESELIHCIRAADLLCDIMRWTQHGGRRKEGSTPPWKENSNFRNLERRFESFQDDLPVNLRLNEENTKYQLYQDTWYEYVTIHAMCTLCAACLYREYMAFSPWNLKKPRGPVDPPLIGDIPPHEDYWVEQARKCWTACQNFTQFCLYECEQKDMFVESPIVAFAAYTVGFCAVYCYHFPYMDHGKILSHKNKISAWDIANLYLKRLKLRIHKAALWQHELKKINDCYRADRKKYQAVGGQPQGSSPSSTGSERGGGGLHQYAEIFETVQKTLGGHNYNIQNCAKINEPHDFTLPEHADHEERRDIGTPIATPKIEPRGTPETLSSRTTSQVSGFTAVNQIERVSAAPSDHRNASPVQRFTPNGQQQPAAQVSQTANGMIGPAYNTYDLPQVPYHAYPSNAPYMAPPTDVANAGDQMYNNSLLWPTAFAPTQPSETDLNSMGVGATFAPQDTKEQMEARGIYPGDFSMFSNNPQDESMGYSQWPPMYAYAPWQTQPQ